MYVLPITGNPTYYLVPVNKIAVWTNDSWGVGFDRSSRASLRSKASGLAYKKQHMEFHNIRRMRNSSGRTAHVWRSVSALAVQYKPQAQN